MPLQQEDAELFTHVVQLRADRAGGPVEHQSDLLGIESLIEGKGDQLALVRL